MKRALAVLGAGRDQLPLIRAARRMGLAVLAFDRDREAPGFDHADEAVPISTRDVEALAAWLGRRPRGEVAGVMTMGSDIPDVVAALAEPLGLPSVSAETARLATDKLAMKERLAAAGIPVPWFAEIRSAEELARLLAERGGEHVLKPVDRSGSRGVFLVDADSPLEELFTKARAFSYTGRVMLEEFLHGPQISTESLLYEGRASTPGFADRNYELLEDYRPRILENGGWVPSLCTPRERSAVEAVVEEAARALGVDSGVAKGDVVLTERGPAVVEIAARLSGGDFASGLVPLGTGVDYLPAAIRLALGEDPRLDQLEPRFERAVANRYLFPEPGRLVAVDGLERVLTRPWVERCELWYRPGEELPPVLSHAHRFGVFVVTGPDRAVAQRRVEYVYEALRVRTERRGGERRALA